MSGPPSPNPTNSPTGWGVVIALLVFVGAFVGSMMGQPSIGFLGGLGLGCLIAFGFWLRDRR